MGIWDFIKRENKLVESAERLVQRTSALSEAEKQSVTMFSAPRIIHGEENRAKRSISSNFLKTPQDGSGEFIFNGVSLASAHAFYLELLEVVRYGGPMKGTIANVFHKTLRELTEKHYPTKIFQLANDRTHELCENVTLDWREPNCHRKAVALAYESEMVLEFTYRRFLPNDEREVHVKRVQVVEIHQDWFMGRSHKGFRNYRYQRMFGSALDVNQEGIPGPEPRLSYFTLGSRNFGQGFHFMLGLDD